MVPRRLPGNLWCPRRRLCSLWGASPQASEALAGLECGSGTALRLPGAGKSPVPRGAPGPPTAPCLRIRPDAANTRSVLVWYIEQMQPLKVRVENGRYVIDEKAELPDGTELYLVPASEGDDLDDAERAALHESIREGVADMKAGRTFDLEEVIAEIRSKA